VHEINENILKRRYNVGYIGANWTRVSKYILDNQGVNWDRKVSFCEYGVESSDSIKADTLYHANYRMLFR
jgi:hypothetical protein